MSIILAIAPFFAIILLGFILFKARIATNEWQRSFNQFSLYVGFPVLIFFYLVKTSFEIDSKAPLLVENSILVISSIVIGLLIGKILKLPNRTTNTLIICLPFGNIAFLGIPIGQEILGSEHLSNLSLIAGIYLFWVFLVAIPLVQWNSKKSLSALKEVIKNPLLIATILGVSGSLLSINLPDVIHRSLDLIASSVTSLVLLSIGIFIASRRLSEFRRPWLGLVITFSTLMVIPLVFMTFSGFFDHSPLAESELLSMMPLAVTPFALADKYELDKKAISVSIVLSTLLLPISLSLLH